jgi:hypothetical protein
MRRSAVSLVGDCHSGLNCPYPWTMHPNRSKGCKLNGGVSRGFRNARRSAFVGFVTGVLTHFINSIVMLYLVIGAMVSGFPVQEITLTPVSSKLDA